MATSKISYNSDNIIVLDQGKVREQGTREELLAFGGLYAEMESAQSADAA